MAKKAAKSDRKTVKGNGGETHQTAGGEGEPDRLDRQSRDQMHQVGRT